MTNRGRPSVQVGDFKISITSSMDDVLRHFATLPPPLDCVHRGLGLFCLCQGVIMYGRTATKLLSVSCCIAVPAAYTFCQPTADAEVADSNKTLDTSSYLDTFLQQEIASILFSSGAAAPPPSIVAPVPFYATPSIQRALHFLTTHSSSHLFVRGNDHTGKTSLLTYLQQSFSANNDLVIELDGTSPAASLSTYSPGSNNIPFVARGCDR
jgi:hypothetical protein